MSENEVIIRLKLQKIETKKWPKLVHEKLYPLYENAIYFSSPNLLVQRLRTKTLGVHLSRNSMTAHSSVLCSSACSSC